MYQFPLARHNTLRFQQIAIALTACGIETVNANRRNLAVFSCCIAIALTACGIETLRCLIRLLRLATIAIALTACGIETFSRFFSPSLRPL